MKKRNQLLAFLAILFTIVAIISINLSLNKSIVLADDLESSPSDEEYIENSLSDQLEKVPHKEKEKLLKEIRDDFSAEILEQPDLQKVPGSILVKFRQGSSINDKISARDSVNAELIEEFTLVPGLQHIKVEKGSEYQAIHNLEEIPHVEYAEQDAVITLTNVPALPSPNDPLYKDQWNLQNIRAPTAWTKQKGSSDVIVAVIDTGVLYTYPDIAGNIWVNIDEIPENGIDDDENGYIDDIHGWDFADDDNDPIETVSNHGTAVAGIIGAVGNNSDNITGINWNVSIMPLKIFPSSTPSALVSNSMYSLQYAAENGAKISSNSYGTRSRFMQSYYDVLKSIGINHGHLAVIASDNDKRDIDRDPYYPCSFYLDNIICVAATNRTGHLSTWWFVGSNYGFVSVDIGAPGTDVISLEVNLPPGYPFPPQYKFNGTSFATPHVSGVAALLLASEPEWNYTHLRTMILTYVRPVESLSDKVATGGILDAGVVLRNLPSYFETQPPKVSIVQPLPGQTVPATSILQANATDNSKVEKVIFTILSDREYLINSSDEFPYKITWSASDFAEEILLPLDEITLKSYALDTSHNIGDSLGIQITIPDNSGPFTETRLDHLGTPPLPTLVEIVVSGKITLITTAQDRSGVKNITIKLNGFVVKSCTASTECNLFGITLPSGLNHIIVEASDNDDRITSKEYILRSV